MPTLALQPGLEQVGNLLTEAGYQIISLENCRAPVDGIIYSGATCGWKIDQVTKQEEWDQLKGPVALINIYEMNPDQAVDLIQYKLGLGTG